MRNQGKSDVVLHHIQISTGAKKLVSGAKIAYFRNF
jgi:hypothetical protein